jgi:hypothetical protein
MPFAVDVGRGLGSLRILTDLKHQKLTRLWILRLINQLKKNAEY